MNFGCTIERINLDRATGWELIWPTILVYPRLDSGLVSLNESEIIIVGGRLAGHYMNDVIAYNTTKDSFFATEKFRSLVQKDAYGHTKLDI